MADPTTDLPPKQRVVIQEKIMNDLKGTISSLRESNKNLEELLKKNQSVIEENQKVIVQQQNTISEQQSTIKEQDEIIRDQQISIVSQQKDLSAANKELKEKTEHLLKINTEWEDQTSLLKNKIFEMKNELSEKEKKYDDMINEREETVKSLTEKINDLELQLEKAQVKTTDAAAQNALAEMEEEIKNLEKTLYEKDLKIKDLQGQAGEADIDLKTELELKDIKIADLEKRISFLTGEASVSVPAGEKGNIILSKEGALDGIKRLIGDLKSSGMIFIPLIDYIDKLDLDQVKSTIRLKIATHIDPTNQIHVDLFKKISTLSNIELKEYDKKDLWSINKDNEALLFAPVGEDGSSTGLIIKSGNHIDFFASLLNSSWTARCKTIRI
ncbi:MAG: hypothetical protein EU551_02470 [Promethearchaeota archaeon]|nr:MAG: hypothetical protein EU551_02470 [Candidatus Lokiarchaeota archaeon]